MSEKISWASALSHVGFIKNMMLHDYTRILGFQHVSTILRVDVCACVAHLLWRAVASDFPSPVGSNHQLELTIRSWSWVAGRNHRSIYFPKTVWDMTTTIDSWEISNTPVLGFSFKRARGSPHAPAWRRYLTSSQLQWSTDQLIEAIESLWWSH